MSISSIGSALKRVYPAETTGDIPWWALRPGPRRAYMVFRAVIVLHLRSQLFLLFLVTPRCFRSYRTETFCPSIVTSTVCFDFTVSISDFFGFIFTSSLFVLNSTMLSMAWSSGMVFASCYVFGICVMRWQGSIDDNNIFSFLVGYKFSIMLNAIICKLAIPAKKNMLCSVHNTSKAVSSAHVGVDTLMLPTIAPKPLSDTELSTWLWKILYNVVDIWAPCFVPCFISNSSDRFLSHLTLTVDWLCRILRKSQRGPGTPIR